MLDHTTPLAGPRPAGPLPVEEQPDLSATRPSGEDERARIQEALGPTPTDIDELIRHTGLHPAQLSMILLELDLAGRLERHAGGMVSLLPGS